MSSESQSIPLYGKPRDTTPVTRTKVFYVDKKKAQQFRELGLPLEPELLDIELSQLLVDADQTTLKYTITYLLRTIHNGTEYVYGLESVTAKDRNGNQLRTVSDLPFGWHMEINDDNIERDSKNEVVYVNPEPQLHKVYDTPFSPEVVKSMVEETNSDTSKMQFCIVHNRKDLSVASYEEFVSLPFEELVIRNTMGMTGYPVDISFLDKVKTGEGRLAFEQLKQNRSRK